MFWKLLLTDLRIIISEGIGMEQFSDEVKKIQASLAQSLTDDQQKVLANLLVLSYHDGYDSGYDQGSADSLEGGL